MNSFCYFLFLLKLKARLITDGVNAGRVTSAREIEIKWFDQVFSEPA